MPQEINLLDLPGDENYAKPLEANKPVGWSDYGRATLAGLYGVPGGIAAGVDYLADGTEEGSWVKSVREWSDEGAADQIKGMSEAGRKALQAGLLPGDDSVWNDDVSLTSGIGLKVANAAPSLLATIIPGGIVGAATRSAVASMGASGAVNASLMGGQVYDDIEKGIKNAKDEDLRASSKLYAQLREDGYTEAQGKKVVLEYAAGNKPAIAGLVGALAEGFGTGATVARGAARTLEGGALRTARRTALEEAPTEAAQNVLQEGMTQMGNREAGTQGDYDYGKIAEQGVQGAVIGGILGAGVGAVTGRGTKKSSDITVDDTTKADPAVDAALSSEPVAPEATPQTARDRAQAGLDATGELLDQNAQDIAQAEAEVAPKPGAKGEAFKAANRRKRVATPDAAVAAALEQTEQPQVDASQDLTDNMARFGEFISPVQQAPVQEAPQALPDPVTPGAAPAEQPAVEPFQAQDEFEVDPDAPLPGDAPTIDTANAGQAIKPQELPQAPPEQTPAGDPSEATQLPIAGEVDLLTLPEVPAMETPEILKPREERVPAPEAEAPRVLESQAPVQAEPKGRGKGPRVTKQEAARVAAGDSDAVTMSNDAADWRNKNDRTKTYRLADAEKAQADKEGRAPAEWAAKVLAARGKLSGSGEAVNKARTLYMEGRQGLSELTQEKVNSGRARRESAEETAQRQKIETQAKHVAVVQSFLSSNPMPEAAYRNPKAMRDYAKSVLAAATRAKVDIPRATTDPHLLYLKNAQVVATEGSGSAAREAFMADDFLLRNGAGEELATRRDVEAVKTEASYDEAAPVSREEREGTDASEAYDAATLNPQEVAVEPTQDKEEAPAEAPAQPADVISNDRGTGPVAATVETAVVAGQNKAGTFQVEARGGRRKFTSPGKVTGPGNAPATIRQAASQVNRAPTEAQKEAGNYAKGHVKVMGLDVSIENPKGATRSGTDKGGKAWSVKMPADYGYVRRTTGADGDHVDVYLGPKAGAENPGNVYVVNQRDATTKKFDEHKAMVGFPSKEAAMDAYQAGFSDGKGQQRVQSVAEMTPDQFKAWVKDPGKGPATAPAPADALSSKAMEAKSPRRPLVEREAEAPAAMIARERSQEDQRAVAELNDMFGRYTATTDFNPDDGKVRVVNSEGVAVEPVVSSNLGEMLKSTPMNTVGGVNDVISPFMSRRLQEMVAEVPVYVVSRPDMMGLTEHLVADGKMETTPQAFYDPKQHHIVIDEAALTSEGALAHLLIHEGMHAAMMRTIERRPDVKRTIRRMMDLATEQTGKTGTDLYGLTNEHEFISEAFSSLAFQDFLAGIKITPTLSQTIGRVANVWEFFISSVRKFLGLPRESHTLLDGALRIGAAMVQVRSEIATTLPSTARAYSPLASQARGQDVVQAAAQSASVIRSTGSAELRRKVMRVQTFDQLRQTWGGLFPNGEGSHLDDVVRGIQRQGPFIRAQRERAEKFAERFTELMRVNPKLAQESAQLRNDLTMANVNVLKGKPTEAALKAANTHIFGTADKSDISAAWQSKAQIAELQKRFSALPEAQQDQILEEAGYYRDMQNQISKRLIENILDTFDVALKPGVRQELITKTMAGTLTEDDAKAIANTTIFNALNNAKELRAIKGLYFPLMRHGDFVVRTQDAIADTRGGVEVQPGVVEFKASKDKDARAQANAFAKDTPLRVTRVAKTYYDPKTGERLKAADADAGSVVGYRVSVQKEGVHFFDTRREAERFIRDARETNAHTNVSDWMVRQDVEARGDLTHSQLSSLVNAIQARDDLPEAQRKMMRTAIGQAAVRLMSGNRIQSKSLPRKMVQGASTEYGRNTLRYGEAASNYLGKLTYMPAVRSSMNEMEKQVRENRYDANARDREHALQEVRRRVDANTVGITAPSRPVQTLMQVSMLTKLAGPSHSIINSMQPAMVTYPMLAGRHGVGSTVAELGRAYRDIGAFGTVVEGIGNTARAARDWRSTGIDTSDVVGSIRKRLASQTDGKELLDMVRELQERGALDDGAQFELASTVAAGGGDFSTALAKMDRVFRQAPTAVEAINRTVSAVAAYRLGRREGMNHEAARDYAFDTTLNSQGDYSAQNAAPFFNNPVARPFLQFKKYGQMMTHAYLDMMVRSFKGASARDRQIARRQFGNLIAVQTLMAGALSLPGLEFAKMAFTLASLAGFGGGWDDQERKIKRLVDESLGESWSAMVRKGIVTRAVGIDLSSRVSLADLWTYGEPESNKKSDVLAWMASQAIGAPGATLFDFREGLLAAQDGNALKAMEMFAPAKVVRDTFNGLRNGLEGKTSPTQSAIRVLGFKTGAQANYDENRSISIAENRETKTEKNALRKRYLEAGSAGDRVKAVAAIREYNRKAKQGNRLNIKTLDKLKTRNVQERRAYQ